VDEVREADTPALEEHAVRKHHLDRLTLALEQLEAARKLDADAVLEGRDEQGIAYRLSIDELQAEAHLIEGITLHACDSKRAVCALRKATKLNPRSSYPFYVLGVMQAARMSKGQALKALRRAVALKPQDSAFRQELDRVQGISVGSIAAYRVTHIRERILDAVIEARVLLARAWKSIGLPRRRDAGRRRRAGSLFRGANAPRYNRDALEKATPTR
jgi:tetratricopeptide (TPR) repeat protein